MCDIIKNSFSFAWDFCLNLYAMRPDYPHKIFSDQRNNYFLLMETLAIDTPNPSETKSFGNLY